MLLPCIMQLPGTLRQQPLLCLVRCATPQLHHRQPGQCSTLQKSRPVHRRQVICAAAAAAPPAGKLLASSEISAVIPRSDLIQQMFRWATIDAQDQGVANFGLPMTVKPTYRNEEEIWGFVVAIHSREGEVLTQLSVRMDEESVAKHDYMGRGTDGFPMPRGKVAEIDGKNLEIRKVDDNPVDERLRSVIKGFCQALIGAINKYYAFGSPFVDEAQ